MGRKPDADQRAQIERRQTPEAARELRDDDSIWEPADERACGGYDDHSRARDVASDRESADTRELQDRGEDERQTRDARAVGRVQKGVDDQPANQDGRQQHPGEGGGMRYLVEEAAEESDCPIESC